MSEEMMTNAAAAAPDSLSFNTLKPKQHLTGVVKRLELYGAFVDVGVGVDALIHISQLGKERVNRVADVLNVGDKISVWVDRIDRERGQFTVTMIQPIAVEWSDLAEGQTYTGKVTRLENFGAFVDIGAAKEGLVHISELSHNYVNHPSEVVKVGDEVAVQVLSFSKRKRRIDLSMKALMEAPEAEAPAPVIEETFEELDESEEEAEDMPTAMEIALRRALGQDAKLAREHKQKMEKQGRSRRDRLRRQQEDLLSRTLASRQNME
ncbi:MAG: hypothetical protein Fur0021_02650 [Candidatus Promineifilaceae bacterium]